MSNELTLPKLISDGMILQRDTDVRIWGQAPSRESVTITFLGKSYTTFSDVNNNWELHLGELPAGGPHTMKISTKHSGEVTIQNILIGDVYLCSGQSNMEHSLGSLAPHFEKEIEQADNPYLRHFKIPVTYSFVDEATDFTDGSWKEFNPENAREFSAVSYFYAKAIYEKTKIPIGLINASQGGSPCQSWLSERAIKDYPELMEQLEPFKKDGYAKEQLDLTNAAIEHWYDTLYHEDAGNQEGYTPWYTKDFDTSDWDCFSIPGFLTDETLPDFRGIVWLQRHFEVSKEMAGKAATLLLGSIVNADTAYINGTYIGDTSYLYPRRRYQVPAGVLTEGTNTITVRLISNTGTCGFVPEKEYALISDNQRIDLTGTWKYKTGLSLNYDRPSELFLPWQPTALFKGMLAPVLPYAIRGFVWYQGESNANTMEEVSTYHSLFEDLIKIWRKRFALGDLPFFFVQLPNWGKESEVPELDSTWAYMREIQEQALALPHTCMAVTYDVGEWNDLHPLDKETVGRRLARLASREIYGESITASSPIIKKIEQTEKQYIVTFHHVGEGLTTSDEKEPGHLFFQDKNGDFHKASATIQGKELLLNRPTDYEAVSIYYAWAASPRGANLCSINGLPVAPFRKQLAQ